MEQPIAKGVGASLGEAPPVYEGIAFVADGPEHAKSIPEGHLLFTKTTNAEYFPAMLRSGGVITEVGGRFSHAAITMMELNKPAVVGAAGVLKGVKSGDRVRFNVLTGEVFKA